MRAHWRRHEEARSVRGRDVHPRRSGSTSGRGPRVRSTPSRNLRLVCIFHEGDLGEGTLQQRLGGLRRLRPRDRRQFPFRRAGGDGKDQGADEQADPFRLRYPPSRRSRLRQSGLGRQRRAAVAHENVLKRCGSTRPGYSAASPDVGRTTAKEREDVEASQLKPPTLLYRDTMIFDDGTHRVELRHFGVGHTQGDGFAWLPKERILFTGDAVVNGPYNYLGDGDSGGLDQHARQGAEARRRDRCAPATVPSGEGGVLEAQRQYFVALRAEVEKRKGLTPDRVQADVPAIREALLDQAPDLHRHASRSRRRLRVAGGAGLQRDDRQGTSRRRPRSRTRGGRTSTITASRRISDRRRLTVVLTGPAFR